ncbi:MAG: hypothetical protein WDM76_17905 [Limisphaerales bacterium]
MRRFPAIVALAFLFAAIPLASFAQEQPSWEVQALSQIIPGTITGNVEYDLASGTAHGTNGIFVRYGDTVLMADSASVNSNRVKYWPMATCASSRVIKSGWASTFVTIS